MVDLYLSLFILICLGLLGWGMARPDRVYQYPFFMGGIFSAFILPQAIALVQNPRAVDQTGVERVLLMSCLCAGMCWIGYQWRPQANWMNRLNFVVNPKKLLISGIVLTIIGYGSRYLISTVPASETGGSMWTGRITIYAFFFSLIYPAFTILLTIALRQPNVFNITLATIAGLPSFEAAFEAGRRQGAAAFVLTVGLGLFYTWQYIPPRWLALGAVLLTVYLIPLVGNYRGDAWRLIFTPELTNGLENVLSGQILELRNAAVLMDVAEQTGQFQYGLGYWDNLVFRFVPAQIVGRGLKDALMIAPVKLDVIGSFGYSVPSGSTITGIGDAFFQFGYLGCVFFGLLGYLFKHFWYSAIYYKSAISQVFYTGLATTAMRSLTHGTIDFFPDLVYYSVFIGIVAFYCREKVRPQQGFEETSLFYSSNSYRGDV